MKRMNIEKASKKNVLEVGEDLCTSCGVCQGVCPNNAISFQQKGSLFLPVVSRDCNHCGLCYDVCSGYGINYDSLNREIFGQVPKDILIGNYLRAWVGHSADDSIRYKSTSGGLVTSLLILALEERLIDGAVVLGMDEGNPLLTKFFIARTREEILSSMGSKYTSGTMGSVISEVMKSEGRYAVVGLPCHIESLRKAEICIKELRGRVVLHFGLFCQTKISYVGLKFWFHVNKINPQEVKEISYRGKGWHQSGMTLKLKHKRNLFYPSSLYWKFVEKFTPIRCTLCTDALSEFADISFGDAWLSEFADDKKGTSIVVVRSQVGDDLIDLAIRKKKIEGNEATRDMVIRSQEAMLKFKKEGYCYRSKILSLLGRKVPKYIGGFIQKGHGSYVGSIVFYLKRYIYYKKFLWSFIYRGTTKYQVVLMKMKGKLRCFCESSLLIMLNPFLTIVTKLNKFTQNRHLGKVKNVLIINQADMLNKGDAAILTGTVKIINQAFPNAKIVVASHTFQVDESRCSVKVVPTYSFSEKGISCFIKRIFQFLIFAILCRLFGSHRIFHLPIFRRLADETLVEYDRADMVVHRGGDNLTEDYGLPHLYFGSILISIVMGKPTVILGESIDFVTHVGKQIAKVILNNVDVIVTRENISANNLNDLEVFKPKIFTLPDVSFVLQPSSDEKLQFLLQSEGLKNLKKPVVAISVSTLISRYAFIGIEKDQKVNHFITVMVDTIKYYQEKLGASFVFIPHVIGKGNDDRIISRQIVDRLENHDDVYVIQGEYSSEDFRIFLAKYADIFIGTRMHANIAATSVGVPTLALAYSQKTYGIIGKMLGLSDFIVDVRQVCNGDELFTDVISKMNRLWECRNEIRKELEERMPKIREEAWKSVEILEDVWKK